MSIAAALVGLSAGSALVLVLGYLAGKRELRALVAVSPRPLREKVRVVIPARNEAERLPATLDALFRDPSPDLEVVVYDDRSDDGTAALLAQRAASEPRLLVVTGTEDPPEGAFGKPLALSRAVSEADCGRGRHEGLWLFLDADVQLAPEIVGGLVQALRTSGASALSGVPRFLGVTLVEQLVVPVITSLVGMRYRPRAVHDEGSAVAFLNGQLILVERAALDEVGGFLAVKDAILEDVALARRLKAQHKRLRLAALQPWVQTRMYTSWDEIKDGFGKNAVALFGGPARTVAVAAAGLGLASAPWLGLIAALTTREGSLLVVATSSLLVGMTSQAALRRASWLPRWPVLVLPVAYLAASFVLLRSALKVLSRKSVTWRGRTYTASRR